MSDETQRPVADSAELVAVVFREHSHDVHRYLARRLGHDLALELTAETFRLALERFESFDARIGSPQAWVFGIASNVLRGHWRTEQRRIRAFERDANRTVASIDPLSTVEDRVDAERRLRDVWVELRALSAQDRDLVLLFAWEQFSYAEIAETLSIPVGTVRSRLNRIRASLTPIEPKEYQRD